MDFLDGLWANNKFRIFYTVATIVIFHMAYTYQGSMEPITEKNIAFWGIITTFVGLVITIFEIIHNVSISRSIKEQASSILEPASNLSKTAHVHEYIGLLEDMADYVEANKYKQALTLFRYFRKSCARVFPDVNKEFKEKNDSRVSCFFGELEVDLFAATRTSIEAPLDAKAQKNLYSNVIEIRNQIEKKIPTTEI